MMGMSEEYPEHDRTSCTDADLNNRGLNENGNSYCRRCNYLHESRLQQRIAELEQQLKDARSVIKILQGR
jgi:hypothetical protein